MIDKAFEFIRDELNNHLITRIPMEDSERVVISNVIQQEEGTASVSDLKDDRVLLSLIHLEEERIFKDQRKSVSNSNGQVLYREPDIKLNLFVIFSCHFKNYLTGLKNLSEVISFFQAHNVFDKKDYPALDARLNRLIMDLHSFSLDQNFQFWQSLGGKFLPSTMYKMRVLLFQEEELQSVSVPITETQHDFKHSAQ